LTIFTPAVPVDGSEFQHIPVNRKILITEVDPETGRKNKVSIERTTEQNVRLKWRDWHGAKSLVIIDLKTSTARTLNDGIMKGNLDWARAGVSVVVAECLRYLRHEQAG
jgi:hypothetical protein